MIMLWEKYLPIMYSSKQRSGMFCRASIQHGKMYLSKYLVLVLLLGNKCQCFGIFWASAIDFKELFTLDRAVSVVGSPLV